VCFALEIVTEKNKRFPQIFLINNQTQFHDAPSDGSNVNGSTRTPGTSLARDQSRLGVDAFEDPARAGLLKIKLL
jgi:hypothetical protein